MPNKKKDWISHNPVLLLFFVMPNKDSLSPLPCLFDFFLVFLGSCVSPVFVLVWLAVLFLRVGMCRSLIFVLVHELEVYLFFQHIYSLHPYHHGRAELIAFACTATYD